MTADRGTLVAAEAIRVRVPLRRPFATSAGSWIEHDAWIIRLRDAAGREGLGEACLGPGVPPSLLDELATRVPTVLDGLVGGVDARAASGGTSPSSAVERALRAAVASASLGFGAAGPAAARAAVAVNATIATEDPEASVAAAAGAVAAGFRTLKLKGGSEASTEALVGRVAAVRAAVGSEVALRFDVNGAWDPATAEERLAALAEHELEYVEDPIDGSDPAALARLRAASKVPIAVDEAVASPEVARRLLAAHAADVLIVKPTRVGGPPAALEIAQVAAEAGIPVVVSTLLETGVGLAAGLWTAARLPASAGDDRVRAHGLATGDLLEHDLLAVPLRPVGGRLAVPAGPGLGVTVDETALERYGIERATAGGSR